MNNVASRTWLLCIFIMVFGLSPSVGLTAGVEQLKDKSLDEYLDDVRSRISNVSADEVIALAKKHDDLYLLDVRMPEEVAMLGGTIDLGYRSVTLNRGWLETRILDLVPDRDTPIVVFCGIGIRSPLATETLLKMGYSNVHNYSEGFFKWAEKGHPVKLPDEAPSNMLFSRPIEVADNVWSAIGATAAPTFENSGHNNNLSFIITDEGVVVVNAGDNYLLAQALHAEIKSVTDKPVKVVVVENGQGHAMLGANYWQEQGVPVVAHEDAVTHFEENSGEIFDRMKNRNRDKAMGTKLTTADKTFTDNYDLSLGGETIEALYLGPAHGPGDIVVWLPKRKLVISGDMAFHERLLPVFEYTDTRAWIETWNKFAALEAEVVIPGHGGPTTMPVVTEFTIGYLRHLRTVVGEVLGDGGSLEDAYRVDQSAYSHLHTYDELAARNADAVYRAMEFE